MSAAEWGPSQAPIAMQRTYLLNGIRYLPHYQKPGVFVGPGQPAPEFGTFALVTAGAVEESYPLLIRGYSEREQAMLENRKWLAGKGAP